MPTLPAGVIADHIDAVNAHDAEAIMATFGADPYVSAEHGEYVGADAVRRFVDREIVGDRISMEPREVVAHHGDTRLNGYVEGQDLNPHPRRWACIGYHCRHR